MALKRDYQLPNGMIANYTRIDAFTYSAIDNLLLINVSIFGSLELRQANYPPALVTMFSFNSVNNSSLANIFSGGANPIAGLYAFLKTQPYYSGATDV